LLALIQDHVGSELRVQLRRDTVRTPGAQPTDQWYVAGDFAAAQQAYIDLLAQLGVPPSESGQTGQEPQL
jgi:hypothetical protein